MLEISYDCKIMDTVNVILLHFWQTETVAAWLFDIKAQLKWIYL